MEYVKMKILPCILCLTILTAAVLATSGCTAKVQAANLMKDINRQNVSGLTPDDEFIYSSTDFAVKLFRLSRSDRENSMVSPLSVMLALAMMANGADGETKSEAERLLGKNIPLEKLNRYLYSYAESLPSENKEKLNIANSIWFRKSRLTVEKQFLQTNADYYGADIYESAFDKQTLKDINNWIKNNTDGMIDKMLDNIDYECVMYIINAVAFDAEWQTKYKKSDIYDGRFTAVNGEQNIVSMMMSHEATYIKTDDATGFIKPYKNGNYSFVALLPNKDIGINEYVSSLNGEKLINTLKRATNSGVTVHMPKFTCEYSIELNNALKTLGIETAFDCEKADFSKLGKSDAGNIYISNVLHKTFFSVDDLGTRAGAATVITIKDATAPMVENIVRLDRPFVYAVIDNNTNIPVFIGTIMNISK